LTVIRTTVDEQFDVEVDEVVDLMKCVSFVDDGERRLKEVDEPDEPVVCFTKIELTDFLYSFIQYDVIVVSPRNHFLFTPLLASTTVGTLEFRTVMEPVRSIKGRDSEREMKKIDSSRGKHLNETKTKGFTTIKLLQSSSRRKTAL